MYMPKSCIANSASRTISNFLRNNYIELWSYCTSLHSHLKWRSVSLSPYLPQYVLLLEFLILVILIGVRWNLRVVLIFVSMMIKDAEHFFQVLLINLIFLR